MQKLEADIVKFVIVQEDVLGEIVGNVSSVTYLRK